MNKIYYVKAVLERSVMKTTRLDLWYRKEEDAKKFIKYLNKKCVFGKRSSIELIEVDVTGSLSEEIYKIDMYKTGYDEPRFYSYTEVRNFINNEFEPDADRIVLSIDRIKFNPIEVDIEKYDCLKSPYKYERGFY